MVADMRHSVLPFHATHRIADAGKSGRLAAEDLELVRMAIDGRRLVAIELAEVVLVGPDAVKLLAQAKADGIELS